jgi:ATP-dependent Clp protease adaptor protein ClpS
MTTDTLIEEKTVTTTNKKIKEPKKYKVIVLNDDYTPMEFVIVMFIRIFRKQHDEAVQLTMKIHQEGSAVAGLYTYEIAEQKAMEAVEFARLNGHPLVVKAEQE